MISVENQKANNNMLLSAWLYSMMESAHYGHHAHSENEILTVDIVHAVSWLAQS